MNNKSIILLLCMAVFCVTSLVWIFTMDRKCIIDRNPVKCSVQEYNIAGSEKYQYILTIEYEYFDKQDADKALEKMQR